MSVVKRPRNQSYVIAPVYDYTANDGKNLADIEEVVYCLQINKSDDDTQYLLKRRTLGHIVVNDTDKTFTITVEATDFDNLKDDESYKQILGIKYTGDTLFREHVLRSPDKSDQLIQIEPNWLQITS